MWPALPSSAVTNEHSGELDGGTEPPEWRTDPLLPVITDDPLPPLETPRIPRLDDHSLASLLAELDDGPPGRPAPAVYAPRRSPETEDRPPRPECLPRTTPGAAEEDLEENDEPPSAARSRAADRHPEGPRPAATAPVIHSEYGDFRPPIHREPGDHDEALNLTGLTERSRGRLGSRLFTVAFVVIFVLIVIQAVVSLLSPS